MRNQNPADIVGRTFTYLTVAEYLGFIDSYHKYRCICICGTERRLLRSNLLYGNTKSCGCKAKEMQLAVRTKHGKCGTPTYRIWQAMMERCLNPKHQSYVNYGARGITVCDRWLSFDNFFSDMGERPAGLQVDRINNDGNYEPSNCRWVTPLQNSRNKRVNVSITIKGETRCVSEWAEITGLCDETIRYRFHAGWPEERLLQPTSRNARTERAQPTRVL